MDKDIKFLLEEVETVNSMMAVTMCLNFSHYKKPEEYIPLLPDYVVDWLKDSVACPEQTIENIHLISGPAFREDATDEEKILLYDKCKAKYLIADWKLHAYFLRNDKDGSFKKLVEEREREKEELKKKA